MDGWIDVSDLPRSYLYWAVVFGVIAGQCLIAVWVAASSRPRWVRMTVALLAIGLLVPIGAPWPPLCFALNAAVTFAIISVARHRRAQATSGSETAGRPWGWRFELGDLFILTLYVAVALALARHVGISSSSFWAYARLSLLGLIWGPLAAFAYHSVAGPEQRKMAVATVLAIGCSVPLLLWLNVAQVLRIAILTDMNTFPGNGARDAIRPLMLGVFLLGGWIVTIAVLVWCMIRPWKELSRTSRIVNATALGLAVALGLLLAVMSFENLWLGKAPDLRRYILRAGATSVPLCALAAIVAGATWFAGVEWKDAQARRHWACIAASAFFIPSAWIYWQMLCPTPFPPPPAGEINHYDRIVAIARQLHETDQGQFSGQPSPKQLELLDEAKRLLAAPNYTPTAALEIPNRYAESAPGLTFSAQYAMFRHLRAAMEAASKRKEYDQGAEYALAAIRFDTMLQRGGTAGFRSFLSSPRGMQWLTENHPALSSETADTMIRELERVLAEREDLNLFVKRSELEVGRRDGWQGRLRWILSDRRLRRDYRDEHAAFETELRSLQTLLERQLR